MMRPECRPPRSSALLAIVVIMTAGMRCSGAELRQLVALVPNFGAMEIQWMDVRWPNSSITSALDVSINPADMNDPVVADALGYWADITFEDPLERPYLGCAPDPSKTHLVCLTHLQDSTPYGGGCCADGVTIWGRYEDSYREVDLLEPVRAALAADGLLEEEILQSYPTHTATMNVRDGVLYAAVIVRITSTALNGSWVDAIVNVPIAAGTDPMDVLPTKDGYQSFLLYRDIGTYDLSKPHTVYKSQYSPAIFKGEDPEQWHTNSLAFFADAGGRSLMAISQRRSQEVIIVADPWEEPGTPILQRFGTPWVWDQNGLKNVLHFFGADPDQETEFYGGLHNPFVAYNSDGKQTITIFVNREGESPTKEYEPFNDSKIYTFEVNLSPEADNSPLPAAEDSVFDTSYTKVDLPFYAFLQGGARPIGDGVYLSGTGAAYTMHGLVAVDGHNNTVYGEYSLPLVEAEASIYLAFFDPFTFLDISPGPTTGPSRQPAVKQQRHKLRKALL